MTARLLALLLLIGVLGYGSLLLLFPRLDAATHWNYQLDRARVLTEAEAFAQRQGVDVTGWMVGIYPARDRNLEQYWQDHRVTQLESRLLSPIKTVVKFRDPRANRTLGFTFAASGQMLSFDRTDATLSEADKNTPPNNALAEQAIAELLGDARAQFVLSSTSEPEKGRRQMVWSYASPEERELKFDAEASVTGSLLTRIEIKPTLPTAYREELSRRDLAAFALFGAVELTSNVLCVLGALVLYFLSLNRKELDHLSSLLFFAVALLVYMVGMGTTTLLNEYKSGNFRVEGTTNPTVLLLLPYVLFGLTCLALSLLLTVLWTTGEATHAKYQTGRLTVFATALRGKLFTRAVAYSVLAGLLTGGLIAAIPYLLAWLGGLPNTPSDYASRHDTFTTQFPAAAVFFSALVSGNLYYLVLLFAFLWPVVRAYLPLPWLSRSLFVLVGTISILDLNPNQTTSMLPKLGIALAWLVLFVWLYWRFDFLAVLTANFAAAAVLKALGLYVQGAPFLHTAGMRALLAFGGLILIAFVLTRLAPAVEPEARQLLTAHEDQAERERLKAEFNVARKAQENLLPASSPQIPGFGIAALCRPARECGGDLYDFIPLSDGKLGIVVADVSGKGVPAALYMTLTKGLLLSVAETTSDPGEILREVNKHLYEVCKRKTFVTLFFGVLDPATKTLTYSRAGHNPPVWRRQSEQLTQWLKPAGIGLGLNAGRSFDRVLKVEQIQLRRDDLLIFYSDGITEAMNEHQEEYGEERLEKVAAITDGMGAEESLSAVFVSVSNFLGKMLPQDDQTLVVVRVT
ncbi:MAG TPA: PP2C family protein-serine/threonine phosphatase [Blastocatellia bacterium]|nr:PP2C family protein-serine/threonine phosphatase [Blastocatellia bacterium]